jgi:RecA-family ATPase
MTVPLRQDPSDDRGHPPADQRGAEVRPREWFPARAERRGEAQDGGQRSAVAAHLSTGRLKLGAAVLAAPRVEPDWVLPGLPVRDVGMIAAPGGTGKTRLGLQLAIGVALGTGWPWRTPPAAPGRVLYLAAEEHPDILRDRLRAIAQATSMLPEKMDRLDPLLDIFSMITVPEATLSAFGNEGPLVAALLGLAERQYRLIIIDPIASFAGIDAENDNAAATRVVKYLRAVGEATGAAVLVLHHVAKSAILNGQTHLAVAARGAIALTDGVRWQAQFTRPPDHKADSSDASSFYRQLVVAKANHVRDGETAWLKFDTDGVLWAVTEPGPAKTPARAGSGRAW